jgi:hypothetical protein
MHHSSHHLNLGNNLHFKAMKEFITDLGSAMPKPDLTMLAIDAPIISTFKSRKLSAKIMLEIVIQGVDI